ncbi:MAG: hypothetical protein M0Z69_14735, partial [Actinomycetota bacterium]|nr:hypothetical protein [Actinomycetota bacterium]
MARAGRLVRLLVAAGTVFGVLAGAAVAGLAPAAAASGSSFEISPYANAFLWFGYNTYNTNLPFGTWSNCPYDPSATPTSTCSATALSNASWDLNDPTYLTPQTRSFVLTSPSTLVESFGTLNQGVTESGSITYDSQGGGSWVAAPASNTIESYSSSWDNGATPYGFVNWGGTLNFSGTPSASTFTNGTLYEWSYITSAYYNANSSTYPDALWVSNENAYLALTSVVFLSSTTLTSSEIGTLDGSTYY